MLHPLVTGTVLGLSAGLIPGPLFTFLISQTLKYNAKEGLRVALSPLVTDLPVILIALFALHRLSEFETVLSAICFLGGSFLLYLSYETFRVNPFNVTLEDVKPRSLLRGALVNALNPHPYLFWFSVGAPLVIKAQRESPWGGAAFIVSFYMLLIGSKIGLALVVGKSRTFLAGNPYIYTMRTLGAALFVLALLLFRDGLRLVGISI
jgi:threonine/homoserine/homoserine lactone efflux protein